MQLYYLLTGAPGSGKSSIMAVLQEKGYTTIPEPAREIIAEQRAINGKGIYDKDPSLFKELMLSRAIHYYESHRLKTKPVFFDRGIPDLLAYSDCFKLPRGAEQTAAKLLRYQNKVFFAPSWREIYQNDEDRQISFEEAKVFGDNLRQIYLELGYQLIELPYSSPEERADFILANLS